MNVYRVTCNDQSRSIKAKTESGAAVFFVKHRVSALKYTCHCKVVNDVITYEVQADNFFIDVTVRLLDEVQGALL